MYNCDGSLRVRTERSSGARGSLSLSWKEDSSKENKDSYSNSPKASPKAAGLKTRVTNINGSNSPLRSRQKSGNDARALHMTSLSQAEPRTTCRISDAKMKDLYESHVFNPNPPTPKAAGNEPSRLKIEENAGHDIFNLTDIPQEPRRSVLGGIRKAPGGGGTLKMDNLHPFTPKVHSKAIKGDFR